MYAIIVAMIVHLRFRNWMKPQMHDPYVPMFFY
jgi:hypothetical protein